MDIFKLNYLGEGLLFLMGFLFSGGILWFGILIFVGVGLSLLLIYFNFIFNEDRFSYTGFIDYCMERKEGERLTNQPLLYGIFLLIISVILIVIGIPMLITTGFRSIPPLSPECLKGLLIISAIYLPFTLLAIIWNVIRFNFRRRGDADERSIGNKLYSVYQQLADYSNVDVGMLAKNQLDSRLRSILNNLSLRYGRILCLGVSRYGYFIELTYSEELFHIRRFLKTGESCGVLKNENLAIDNFILRVLKDL